MNLFSVDFTLGELQIVRQSLDVISISGKDAKILAALQIKLESEIQNIQTMLQQTKFEKQQELIKTVEADKKKTSKS
jgi:hypothetical protein